MLVGQLPDLRETQSGKDLIAIGRSEGKIEGKIEGLIEGSIQLLEIRFGEIPKPLRDELLQIKSTVAVDALYKKLWPFHRCEIFRVAKRRLQETSVCDVLVTRLTLGFFRFVCRK